MRKSQALIANSQKRVQRDREKHKRDKEQTVKDRTIDDLPAGGERRIDQLAKHKDRHAQTREMMKLMEKFPHD